MCCIVFLILLHVWRICTCTRFRMLEDTLGELKDLQKSERKYMKRCQSLEEENSQWQHKVCAHAVHVVCVCARADA